MSCELNLNLNLMRGVGEVGNGVQYLFENESGEERRAEAEQAHDEGGEEPRVGGEEGGVEPRGELGDWVVEMATY